MTNPYDFSEPGLPPPRGPSLRGLALLGLVVSALIALVAWSRIWRLLVGH